MIFKDRPTEAPLDEGDTIADRLERILGSDPELVMLEAAKRQRMDGNMNPFVEVTGDWSLGECRSFRAAVPKSNLFGLRNAMFAEEHVFLRCPIPGCTLEDFMAVVRSHARAREEERRRDQYANHPDWTYHPHEDLTPSFRFAAGMSAEEIHGFLAMERLR